MKESQHTEWKESWRDEYLKWICGFANAEGGVLTIGRNDRGMVTGLPNAARLLEEIPNKGRDILGIMVEVNLRKQARKEFLEIVVEPYPYPVSYKGEYHYRSGSTKQELKGAALDTFLLRKQGRHWDGVPVPQAKLTTLDAKALAWFRKQARKSQRLPADVLREANRPLLDKLHLLEGTYLKRAAVLLFHPDPERFTTGAFVKIGHFESDSDLRYQDEVHGDLFTQVNQTIETLKAKYLKALISYEGLQRVETYPVPEAALREAVLNAVVHKDYAGSIPVQISVYADKLMIWNPGQLPSDWTIETLTAKHASRPFNPDIANAFFRAGMIESWGRGIERMFSECAAAGFPVPQLRHEPTGLWITFEYPAAHAPLDATKPVSARIEQPEPESRLESRLAARIVMTLKKAAQGKAALAAEFGHATVSGELHKQVKRLREFGLIEMTMPDQPGSRMQRYRLANAGDRLLAEIRDAETNP